MRPSALIILVALIPVGALSQFAGEAIVLDGSTLVIEGNRLYLHGIFAPRLEQVCLAKGEEWPCGRMAAAALRQRIGSQPLGCTEEGEGGVEPVAVVCRVGDVELNAWLVSEGWALAGPPAYQEAEQQAIAAGKGIWREGFSPSRTWRLQAGLEAGSAEACNVCTLRHRAFTRSQTAE